MKTKIQKYIFKFSNWLIITFVFSSCAQIVPPTGGPRDVKPPHAIKYIPDSAATNFNSKNIAIVFSEYIVLADLQKQLVVSPPLNNTPNVTAKGKTLFIELQDTLQKDVTYTFNFGNSIRDFTEANMADGFQYVFSTGSYIDSLKLSGTVKNIFDMKTEKDILVMLYADAADSVPYKKRPFYFTKTKENGSYRINNIRPGIYKAFALKDANMNYLYDSREESIAFPDSLLKISSNKTLDFSMFKETPAKQKLKRAVCTEHGHLVLAFERPLIDSVKLHFLSQEPKENIFNEYSQSRDTVHYWFSDDLKDTMKIELSIGNEKFDTISIKPITLEQMKKVSRGGKWGLNTSVNISKNAPFDFKSDIVIKFSHPVPISADVFSEKIFLTGNTKNSNAHISIKESGDKFARTLSFNDSLLPDSSYHLFIPAGAFKDIFGNINDTIKVDFKTQEEKFYGTLKMNLKMKKEKTNCIVQFIDEKGNVVREENTSEGKMFNYSYLYPGKCKMKLIYDTNGDGKWTTGNYLQHRQAEKIIYYPGEITIRSNWDLELEWSPSP
jgi:hypothetical protein